MPKRPRYRPRLSWSPIVRVRTRRYSSAYYGRVSLGWRLYLFGVVPTIVVPRRSDVAK